MNTLIAFQKAIVATGTAQNLPSNPVSRSVTVAAKSTNTADVVIGNSSAVTATTGFILAKGTSVTMDLEGGNTDQIWVVGTSADVVSVTGA